MKRTTNVAGLHTFLGFIRYLSKFPKNIHKYNVAAPLRVLLERKNTEWNWTSDQGSVLNQLKDFATDAPVFQYLLRRKST